jgi:type VI secretion system protein ImpA
MPLRNDLLNPISGPKPGGENLRYSTVFDEIKEARRQDDQISQGEFVCERKLADWPLAMKLIQDALATKSKDLWLAAWLADAMLREEGVSAFREALDLTTAMLEKFWDDLYPELEDGDAELRAAPLQWIGCRLDVSVRQIGLTTNGLDYCQYRESRWIGDEKSANTEERRRLRETEIAAGKIPLEVFDGDFDRTPEKFYVDLLAALRAALDSLTALISASDKRFQGDSPYYVPLQQVLQEVWRTAHDLWEKKHTETGAGSVLADTRTCEMRRQPDVEWGR